MTPSPAHRPTISRTTTASATRADVVAEVMAFVDTQRMREKFTCGWFGEVETELRKKIARTRA